MIDIEIVLQNLAKKWKTDLLKSFRCPLMMLGYKAILCSDENTFGISVKKYKMMKNYLQTSTTSTLLVTAVPAMTTTAASAGVYFTSSYFMSHFLILCHIFLFYVTFSHFNLFNSFLFDWKLKNLIFSGTSNASDGGVAITTWRHLNIVDPLH